MQRRGQQTKQTNGHVLLRSLRPHNGRCRHHWLIETPNGARSPGTCKCCGRSKSFPNAFEDILEMQRRARLESMMLSKTPRLAAS